MFLGKKMHFISVFENQVLKFYTSGDFPHIDISAARPIENIFKVKFVQIKFDKEDWMVYTFEVLFSSFGSVFSYNSYKLDTVIGEKRIRKTFHAPQFMKQLLYITFNALALLM